MLNRNEAARLRKEKIDAAPAKRLEIRRMAHWIDAKLSRNDADRLSERNRHSACRAVKISTQRPLDRRSHCGFALSVPDFNALSPGHLKTPQPKEDPSLHARNRRKACPA
ncbi:hypothetical protein NDU88_001478 [Pleurodeles waltl]|uniref:Uncharacterized protein n=1 Tax=Pleurodeles waltl TaxID=8319 RepID=A0AAV7R978_PLEWA|nr:hypothetical protein NDU88_001478 [Pleurodeles waltl]